MTVRITKQGCRIETTCTIQPNGRYTESVVLSVDPTSSLSVAVEERAGRPVAGYVQVNLPPRYRL
jgi:hypothetical protein